jgi:hypothetical protein
LPFWIVRICLMLIFIAAFAWILSQVHSSDPDIKDLVQPGLA